jgi:quercetin dioxygenase-like cupin family protein
VIRSSTLLESPEDGVRVVFRRTSRETGGRAVVFEAFLEPTAGVASLHVHPKQEERVQVLAGRVGARIGDREAIVGPGTLLTAPAGTSHRLWNAGDEVAHIVVELRPALEFESLVEALFSLAERTDGDGGLRSLLRLAVVAAAHSDEIRLPFALPVFQRLGLGLVASLGRAWR